MAKQKQCIIPLTDTVAFKFDTRQWILAYKYTNGKTGEESWIPDRYYMSISEMFAKLPDYLLKRSDLTSVQDLLEQCQTIVTRLGSIEDLYKTLKQTEVDDNPDSELD